VEYTQKQLRHHRMRPVIIHSVSGPGRSDNLQMAYSQSSTSSVWLTPDGGVVAAETRHKVRLMEESTRSDHG
jgi:hypothetical protein